MVDTLNEKKQNKGAKNAPEAPGGESMLLFKPLMMGHETVSVKRKLSSLSGYKVALFAGDLVAAFSGFAIGLWLIAGDVLVYEDRGAVISFFILSLTSIAFFRPNHLYSYRFLFTRKNHLSESGQILLLEPFCSLHSNFSLQQFPAAGKAFLYFFDFIVDWCGNIFISQPAAVEQVTGFPAGNRNRIFDRGDDRTFF